MLKTSLHCDGCLRTQTEDHGWFVVTEAIQPVLLDDDGPKLGVHRALILRDLKLGELPSQGKAYCGMECLTKAVHAWTEVVLREQAERGAA